MSYLKSVGTAIIYIGLFLAVITFVPGLPPETEFKEYSIVPSRDIKPKNRLNGAEKLFNDEINAPEAFDSYDGHLYTGIHGGYIVRIDEDGFVPIVKFGEKCDGIWQEHKCGRPLGLKFDKKGNLFVADAYYGLFKVDVKTGEYENIVNISKPIDGKLSRITNNVDVAKNGDLYWTISSTDYALYDLVQSILANPSGRLMRYNAAKKENEVLMRDLAFANGVILSEDESFVIVAETMKNRIMKYNLKGPKAGQQEIFTDGLPGLPDNLHSDGQGGFLVTTVVTIDSEHPQLSQSLAPHPYLRKMLVRLLFTLEFPFKLLNDIYPNMFVEKILHAIGSFQGVADIIQPLKISLIIRIDASGNIMEVLSSDDDTIGGVSAAYIYDGYLWFGTPWRHYLARVPLKQAFPDLANSEKQSSQREKRSIKQSPNASDVKSEKTETVKPVESKPKKAQTTTKPTAAPTTSKPTPAPTTTPKPTAAPKVDKSAATGSNNMKPSETKSTSKSTTAEVKKDSAKTVNDVKPDAKSNAKSETNSRKEDAAKTSTKSEKNVKAEDASVKQKSQSEKVKKVETNRPADEL